MAHDFSNPRCARIDIEADPFAAIKADLGELRDNALETGLSAITDFTSAGWFKRTNDGKRDVWLGCDPAATGALELFYFDPKN